MVTFEYFIENTSISSDIKMGNKNEQNIQVTIDNNTFYEKDIVKALNHTGLMVLENKIEKLLGGKNEKN